MLLKIFLAEVPSGIVSFNFIGPLLKILSINIASDTFPSIKKVPVGTFEAKPRIRILAFNTFLLTIRLFSCNRLITLFKDIPLLIEIVFASISLLFTDKNAVLKIIRNDNAIEVIVSTPFIRRVEINLFIISNQ